MGELVYSELRELLMENVEESRAIEVMKFQIYPEEGKSYDYYASIAAKACAKRDLSIFLSGVDEVATIGIKRISPVGLKLIIDFRWKVNGFVLYKATQLEYDEDIGTIQAGFVVQMDPFIQNMQNTIFENIIKNTYLQTLNELLGVEYKIRKKADESIEEYCWGIDDAEKLILYR